MHKVWISRIGSHLDREIEAALEWLDWRAIVDRGARVAIKPNFTWPVYRQGVTTSPAVIEALVRALTSRTHNINIVEADGGSSAWSADEAFAGHGIPEICRRYGVGQVNLTRYPRDVVETRIAERPVAVELSRLLTRETDIFISLPVPKLHAMTGVSLGFKNQWGCLPDVKRLRHHSDFACKILAINKILQPKLAIFDGTWFLDRGGPLEGDPVHKDLLVAATDVGASSLVCCELMGVNPKSVSHLRLAMDEAMMPSTLDEVTTNAALDSFTETAFRLQRTWRQWLSLAAFHSYYATIVLYDSPLARPAHELLYFLQGRPADLKPKS